MEILSIIGLSFVGAVFWVISTEGLAMYYGGALGWHPVWIGLLCSLGQNANYVCFYFGGKTLVERWRWLAAKVAFVEKRYHHSLQKGYLITTGFSAVFGVPPVIAMAALASGFHIRLQHFLAVSLAGRWLRFTILAWSGDAIISWWQGL